MNDFQKTLNNAYIVEASPIFWRRKAEELKYASEILWPHCEEMLEEFCAWAAKDDDSPMPKAKPNIFSIYLSLIGFSTEALFKGIIIRDNPGLISNGKMAGKLKSHDLIMLSNWACANLSQNEYIFCGQAIRAMTFESRYPIPKEAEFIGGSGMGGHCKDVFTEMYNRIYPTIGQITGQKKC